MSLSYNLTFSKVNGLGKTTLEKDGEILLHERGFQLRGKGAYDQGEVIHFSDVADVTFEGKSITFTTFSKFHYVLKNLSNLFDQFVHDFFRARNEFLLEALFLKQGKHLLDFDGSYEYFDADGNCLHKGPGKMRLYEESLVIMPRDKEALSIPFSFLKMHEFDEDEYHLILWLDEGQKIIINQFGNQFEEIQEKFEHALTLLYSDILKGLQNFFISFRADVLVKLANAMKRGKLVRMKDLQKIDSNLAKAVYDAVFKDDIFLKTIEPMKKHIDDEHLFLGLRVVDGKKDVYHFLVVMADEKHKLFSCTVGSYEGDVRKVQDTYFFRMQGSAIETISMLNRAFVLMHFSLEPLWKDQRELSKSLYKLAIQKLPFVRAVRDGFLGRCPSILPDIFARNLEKFLK